MTMNSLNIGIKGEIRCVVKKAATEEIVEDTGYFDNLILDNGLNAIVNRESFNYLCIGTGNSIPNASQTSLDNKIKANYTGYNYYGRTTTTTNNVYNDKVNNLVKRSTIFSTRFGEIENQNITEIGFATDNRDNKLVTRALIKNNKGEPTSISVRSDEVLDIYYRLWSVVPNTVQEFDINLHHMNGDEELETVPYKVKVIPALTKTSLLYFNIDNYARMFHDRKLDYERDINKSKGYWTIYNGVHYREELKGKEGDYYKAGFRTFFYLDALNDVDVRSQYVEAYLGDFYFDFYRNTEEDKAKTDIEDIPGFTKNSHQTFTFDFELRVTRYEGDTSILLEGVE